MQPLAENSVNVPAFLGKLWKMVNDPSTDHLISWSAAGNSFIIQNQAQFWYELLPLYYKHNNMSSFVRQLNMYGFHKISTVENGTMDADKDEIQFFHPYFQKEQPELLKIIKRKVTATKATESTTQNLLKHDDLAKVLTDVKQLRGRQSSVDSQLTAMKQENAVLWRELALLRQKHIKQQQIVNKLIQFLVTLVQPSASARMGVGVKRRMPLMLHENPVKKPKSRKPNNNNIPDGPTIHELDNEIEITPEQLFEEEVEPLVASNAKETFQINSPLTPTTSAQKNVNSPQSASSVVNDDASRDSNLWDKSEFVEINEQPQPLPVDEMILSDNELPDEILTNNFQPETGADEKIFLNPNSRDALLSNLINGSFNSSVFNGKGNVNGVDKKASDALNAQLLTLSAQPSNDMTVAKMDNSRTNPETVEGYRDDLDLHLETTQNELDQLKDILNGCNTFDANALLGVSVLFNEESPDYGLTFNPSKEELLNVNDTADPLVSGSELATCGSNLIDFNELFDDSADGQQDPILPANEIVSSSLDSAINTPLIVKSEPLFPTKQ